MKTLSVFWGFDNGHIYVVKWPQGMWLAAITEVRRIGDRISMTVEEIASLIRAVRYIDGVAFVQQDQREKHPIEGVLFYESSDVYNVCRAHGLADCSICDENY